MFRLFTVVAPVTVRSWTDRSNTLEVLGSTLRMVDGGCLRMVASLRFVGDQGHSFGILTARRSPLGGSCVVVAAAKLIG